MSARSAFPDPNAGPPALSVVIVTWNSASSIAEVLGATMRELLPGDEIVLVDNASEDDTVKCATDASGAIRIIQNGTNIGFAAAANHGAAAARGDLLVFLNPDAVPQPGFGPAIRLPLIEERGWTLWQGLVLSEDGTTINSAGGEVHFTGVSWAGKAGRPVGDAPTEPTEVAFASGACLAVERERWNRLGGFPADFFMYFEDVDLSLRAWGEGGRVGIEPRAQVIHDYEFEKGRSKWRYLERNRISTVIRTYPTRLSVACTPALIATELAIIAAASAGGWLGPKARSYFDLVTRLPRLFRERRRIAENATRPTSIQAALQPDLSSIFLGRLPQHPILRVLLRTYWQILIARDKTQ